LDLIRYDDDVSSFVYIYNEENQRKIEIVFDLLLQLGYWIYHQSGHSGYQVVPDEKILPIYWYYSFIWKKKKK
jgi:predicted acetyltransferase